MSALKYAVHPDVILRKVGNVYFAVFIRSSGRVARLSCGQHQILSALRGRSRSAEELASLLSDAGFKAERIESVLHACVDSKIVAVSDALKEKEVIMNEPDG